MFKIAQGRLKILFFHMVSTNIEMHVSEAMRSSHLKPPTWDQEDRALARCHSKEHCNGDFTRSVCGLWYATHDLRLDYILFHLVLVVLAFAPRLPFMLGHWTHKTALLQ